jgi:hypothetical protein
MRLRVPGHRLQAGGAPHTGLTCQRWPCDTLPGIQRVNRIGEPSTRGISGHGHALCECGWTSSHLLSGAERRRAHREHKRTVRSAATV